MIDSAPAAHTRALNSGQDFGNCQPSIINSSAPTGKKMCLHILVMGCSLISFKICSTWTQMTVNDSCGTLHTVWCAIVMACSPAVNARCLHFYNELIKLPKGSRLKKTSYFIPDNTFYKPASGWLKHNPFLTFTTYTSIAFIQ